MAKDYTASPYTVAPNQDLAFQLAALNQQDQAIRAGLGGSSSGSEVNINDSLALEELMNQRAEERAMRQRALDADARRRLEREQLGFDIERQSQMGRGALDLEAASIRQKAELNKELWPAELQRAREEGTLQEDLNRMAQERSAKVAAEAAANIKKLELQLSQVDDASRAEVAAQLLKKREELAAMQKAVLEAQALAAERDSNVKRGVISARERTKSLYDATSQYDKTLSSATFQTIANDLTKDPNIAGTSLPGSLLKRAGVGILRGIESLYEGLYSGDRAADIGLREAFRIDERYGGDPFSGPVQENHRNLIAAASLWNGGAYRKDLSGVYGVKDEADPLVGDVRRAQEFSHNILAETTIRTLMQGVFSPTAGSGTQMGSPMDIGITSREGARDAIKLVLRELAAIRADPSIMQDPEKVRARLAPVITQGTNQMFGETNRAESNKEGIFVTIVNRALANAASAGTKYASEIDPRGAIDETTVQKAAMAQGFNMVRDLAPIMRSGTYLQYPDVDSLATSLGTFRGALGEEIDPLTGKPSGVFSIAALPEAGSKDAAILSLIAPELLERVSTSKEGARRLMEQELAVKQAELAAKREEESEPLRQVLGVGKRSQKKIDILERMRDQK